MDKLRQVLRGEDEGILQQGVDFSSVSVPINEPHESDKVVPNMLYFGICLVNNRMCLTDNPRERFSTFCHLLYPWKHDLNE
ncbi:uncharacterized protein LOC141849881 isoform X2 [Brevipalpus obovatus]|uniref:uncharacterized protein LOC141849881 isoform X2 n=1 Tax=Brevipalpus obovatus TaxID=246614 RepID=UPI003D9ECDD1